MPRRDPYVVLDVSPLASFEEARSAYRRLAAIFHPDRFVDARAEVRAEAEKQMGYVNEAWAELEVTLRIRRDATQASARRPGSKAGWVDDDLSAARAEAHTWGPEADFTARARHVRTKERAYRRSAAATEERARAEASAAERAAQAERAEWLRQARERLEAEQVTTHTP